MSSSLNQISPVQVEISIVVPKEEIETTVVQMLHHVSREAKVPGFRRGKVPLNVARRMFGKSVMGEVRENLIQRHFIEALREHEVIPVSEPDFNFGELSGDADFTFSAMLEIAPQLEAINTDGIEIEKYKLSVSEDDVNKEILRIQSSMATVRDFETPRPVALGDMVTLVLRREVDGVPSDEPMPPQDFHLEEERTPKELLAVLPGMKVGEEVPVTFGENTPRAITFLCTVSEHKERVLPALDDEFAKDLGDFETIDALKADIEKRKMERLEHAEDERLKHALLEAVKDKNPMELPPRILARQTEAMKKQFDGMLDKIKTDANLDEDEDAKKPEGHGFNADESSSNAARDIVHMHFLIEEISRLEKLEVTEADVDAELVKVAESTGMTLPRIRAEYAKGGRMLDFKTRLLESKVFDFLLPKVTINLVDPPIQE